jgi:multiple antibiotic resistance protein
MPHWEDVRLFFEAAISLFAIVNPIGNLPIFIGLTANMSSPQRKRLLRLAGVAAFAILAIMAVAGNFLLAGVFHIGLSEFAFGGGIVLIALGIKQLLARPLPQSSETTAQYTQQEEQARVALAISPIACPLLVGPGSIVTVMLIVKEHSTGPYGVWAGIIYGLAASLVAFMLVLLILNYCNVLFRLMGQVVVIAVGRVMQIFIVAIGVHFAFKSLSAMFPSMLK